MIRKMIRQRSHRLPRQYYRGRVLASFTACLQNREHLFQDKALVGNFVSILDWACRKNDCIAVLYCFMPDHLHLVMAGQSERADLYQAMLDFKQHSGFLLHTTKPTSRWQKGFHDRIIWNEPELPEKLRYIAENPVRQGLVSCWFDYPFTNSLGIPFEDVIELMFG